MESECQLANEARADKVVLYSTHCPRCSILEKKLSQLGIQYELNTNINEMLALGLKSAPVLSINGELLDFAVAVEWLNKHNQED